MKRRGQRRIRKLHFYELAYVMKDNVKKKTTKSKTKESEKLLESALIRQTYFSFPRACICLSSHCVVHVLKRVMHNVHASECAYVQKTLCDGSFSLVTELWTTGFVVCLGSHGGSWMMLPQLSEGRPCLASSRTALTGYHRRNCGFCPALFFKKAVSKGLGRVSLFQQMLEQCVVALWKPISTMVPI